MDAASFGDPKHRGRMSDERHGFPGSKPGESRARRHMAWRRFSEADGRVGAAEGARILDIGTGSGAHVMMLADMGMDPIGVDLERGGLEAAVGDAVFSAADCRLLCADGAHLPFADGVFHAVSMVETIEHVFEADRRLVFEECYRVLAPGGRLVLTTPNTGGLVERIRRLAGGKERYRARSVSRSDYRPDDYHLPWPVRRMALALEEAGFKPLEPRYFLFVIRTTPAALLRLAVLVEKALEAAPGVNRLALGVCLTAEKPSRIE